MKEKESSCDSDLLYVSHLFEIQLYCVDNVQCVNYAAASFARWIGTQGGSYILYVRVTGSTSSTILRSTCVRVGLLHTCQHHHSIPELCIFLLSIFLFVIILMFTVSVIPDMTIKSNSIKRSGARTIHSYIWYLRIIIWNGYPWN
jgi:hypothetical protein